jgi:hypothetical protein
MSVVIKVQKDEAEKAELDKIVEKMNKIKETLYGKDGTSDPQILDHIELWSDSGAVDLTVLKKYVKNLETASINEIEVGFRNFVDNHNKVLFGHILPQLELLNELYRLINVADRKLGESDKVKVIGRINEMVNNIRPTLGNWLSVQKDLQSRLKYELDLASAKKPKFLPPQEGGKKLAFNTNWKNGWDGLHVDANSPVRLETADLNSKLFGDQMFYTENGEWIPNAGKLILPNELSTDLVKIEKEGVKRVAKKK